VQRMTLLAGVLLPVLLLAAGCLGGVRRGEALDRPIILQTPAEERGQLIYMKNCYRCHQGGEGGLGPSLYCPLPDAVIRVQVRHGLEAMPAFPPAMISDHDLDDLLAYLKAVRRS
jgi:mono/diheme cytochrome c family protein